MIRMKIEMTHLNDNAAQVFGNSFTHGTRYFKGHCIVWLFASCTCMDGVGAIMSNVCDTDEGEMIIQFNCSPIQTEVFGAMCPYPMVVITVME